MDPKLTPNGPQMGPKLDEFSNHVGVILGQFWDHDGIIFGSFWGHVPQAPWGAWSRRLLYPQSSLVSGFWSQVSVLESGLLILGF